MGQVDLTLLERQWQSGRLQSGFILGVTYLKGRKGVTADKRRGLDYLRKSARRGYLRAAIYLAFYYAGIWGPEESARLAAARYWDFQFRKILKERGNRGDWWAREQYLGHMNELRNGSFPWLFADLDDSDTKVPHHLKDAREQRQFRAQWRQPW